LLALLEETDAWRCLPTPPRFVLRALEHLVAAQPAHPGWRRSLEPWLQLWDLAALGPVAASLATVAGLSAMSSTGETPVPLGMPAVPWLLHQAARTLRRDRPSEALTFLRRALALDPEWANVPNASLVRETLTELERYALAERLALVLQPEGDATPIAAGVLVDALESLTETADGTALLDVLAGDPSAARARLLELTERTDLSPRLAHHLALLLQRAAQAWEQRDENDNAETYWRHSWHCWLRFLASADAMKRRHLLDWLLRQHRHRLGELLARSAVDAARRYFNLIRALPARAAAVEETLGRDLAERIERFGDELATDYLLTTREAMRFGAIPEGWRADYEKGLTYLRRLLSLDRDNCRLLAALVEICNDWFLDLYHLHDGATLRAQLERFTPFALQLARRIDDRPGDLTARSALSDFWKFRGFLAADRAAKLALYREALRFNPANTNVRELLDELTSP
jgi:hypothetical protein